MSDTRSIDTHQGDVGAGSTVLAAQRQPLQGTGSQQPVPTDPLGLLNDVIAKLAAAHTSGKRIGNKQIAALSDECKTAILLLQSGVWPNAPTALVDVISYTLETRDAYTTAIAGLIDAARARDPYAAQLQIG